MHFAYMEQKILKNHLKIDDRPAFMVKYFDSDEGNIAYDYFVSGTRDGVMMICETWQNAKVLKTHMESAHFTTLVPQIEALTKHGLKLEQFQFEK